VRRCLSLLYPAGLPPEVSPDIRVCFAHGGQLAQINLGRRIQGFDGRPDLFEGKVHPRKAVGHPNIFFDTLVHDTGSLELMIRRQGCKQIIMGLDDPYPLGEMESEPQSSYPGKILDLALEEGLINQQQHDEIWCNNVLKWLGEEYAVGLREKLETVSGG
jgi:aminocarboxymuconate-semialdehyde decarboxylase